MRRRGEIGSGLLIESSLSMSRANHKVSNPRASCGEAFAQNVRHPNCVFKSRSQSSPDELPVPFFSTARYVDDVLVCSIVFCEIR